jgi:hypothetical protein
LILSGALHFSHDIDDIAIGLLDDKRNQRWLLVVCREFSANDFFNLVSCQPCSLDVADEWERDFAVRPNCDHLRKIGILPDQDFEDIPRAELIVIATLRLGRDVERVLHDDISTRAEEAKKYQPAAGT